MTRRSVLEAGTVALDTCLVGDCRKVMPTQPFEDAHFATFPPKLIEPCILAGSRPGDIVLDPFLGSGTTAEVAPGAQAPLARDRTQFRLYRDAVAQRALA